MDCETGKPLGAFFSGLVPGRTYRCERRWMLKQSYNLLKTFVTREEAQETYDSLLRKLAEVNTVIEI